VPGEKLGHYARLVSTPIEYLLRLDSTVRDSVTWSAGGEHQAIRDKITEICDACKAKLFEEAPTIRRIYTESADEQATLTPVEELALRSILRSTAGTFTALHELLLFLPRESIRRELRDYCLCLFGKEFDNTKISLILTSLFNAFEYSLDDVMRFLEADVFKFKIPDPKSLSFGTVMELAIVDRANPLAWAVLAHEFGHFLDHNLGLRARAVNEFVAKTNTTFPDEFVQALERLSSEIIADLTGYYLQGPCSILPLVNMSILIGCIQEPPIKFDGEHGAPSTRVEMIKILSNRDGLDIARINPQFEVLITEERQKELQLPSADQQQRTLIHQFLTTFFEQVGPIILEELEKRQFHRFQPANYERAETLSRGLANGLPVGACRVHGEQQAREHLLSKAEPGSIRDNYFLLEERAASVSEVVTAGWINRIERSNELYREAFTLTTAKQAFTRLASGLAEQDRLIFKSIDMIPMLEAYHAPAG
jgi:hypothetical protein